MKYWFPSIKSHNSHENRFTSFEKAENYRQDKGETIKQVPVDESKEAIEDWIQEQDDPDLYYPLYFFTVDSQSNSERQNNPDRPKQIYIVV